MGCRTGMREVSIVFKPHASEKRKQVTVYNILAS